MFSEVLYRFRASFLPETIRAGFVYSLANRQHRVCKFCPTLIRDFIAVPEGAAVRMGKLVSKEVQLEMALQMLLTWRVHCFKHRDEERSNLARGKANKITWATEKI